MSDEDLRAKEWRVFRQALSEFMRGEPTSTKLAEPNRPASVKRKRAKES